jgi:hypothetical protein
MTFFLRAKRKVIIVTKEERRRMRLSFPQQIKKEEFVFCFTGS